MVAYDKDRCCELAIRIGSKQHGYYLGVLYDSYEPLLSGVLPLITIV